MSVWNNFISVRGNLPEIISKLFHRLTAANMFIVAEIILKLFQHFISHVTTDSGYMWNKTLKLPKWPKLQKHQSMSKSIQNVIS